MMKGLKEKENLTSPLFPRLRIKDAEQGGPNAPPRNKMALYEQLSIPSQKYTSGLASVSPFTPINGCNSVPSASSTHQGGGQKRSPYSPICDSPAPAHLSKRLHSYSSDVMNLHATSINLEWKPLKPAMHHPLDNVPFFVQSGETLKCSNGDKNEGIEKVPSIEEKGEGTLDDDDDDDDDSSRIASSNGSLPRQNRALVVDGISTEPTKGVQKGNASMFDGVSCFRNHNKAENVTECCEDHCGPLQMGELDGNADVSDKCVVDSVSGVVEILPDDVVGVIGQKQFLKTRRVILHQQRVFAVQVFELHRLIKVQKLFAASPELLLQNELYPGNSSIKALLLPFQKSTSLNLLQAPPPPPPPPPFASKLKPQKQNQITRCAADNVLEKPRSSLSNHSNIRFDTQQQPGCYVHPSRGNQWLLPILSPSEGLVYKPYTGLAPPTSGFGVPVYGITTSTHQEGIGSLPDTRHTYFSPFTMPPIPSASCSAFEVARQLNKSHPNGSEEKSYFVGNSQTSSGGTERVVVQGEELALFPTDPTFQVSDQASQSCSNEQRTRVIKVVPHNRRSASASAARIFQSIQEERRQYI